MAPDSVIRYEGGPLKVLLVDAGAKDNMVRSLLKRGATVVRAPWHTDLARSPPSATAWSSAMAPAIPRT